MAEEKVNDLKEYVTSSEFTEHIASDEINDCIDTSIQVFTHALLNAASCMKKTGGPVWPSGKALGW